MSNNDLISSLIQTVAPSVIRQLSAKFGIDEAKTNQILEIAVPLIVSGLKSLTEKQAITNSSLGDPTQEATNAVSEKLNLNQETATEVIGNIAPLVMNALSQKKDITSLIDQNGDGQILDDIAGFFMKGFK